MEIKEEIKFQIYDEEISMSYCIVTSLIKNSTKYNWNVFCHLEHKQFEFLDPSSIVAL